MARAQKTGLREHQLRRQKAFAHQPLRPVKIGQHGVEQPRALRQGIGRLIRDANDWGVLMICDPRILTKSYGRIFRNSLPGTEWTRSLDSVREFLRGHEPGDTR